MTHESPRLWLKSPIPPMSAELTDWLHDSSRLASGHDMRGEAFARIHYLETMCEHLWKLASEAVAISPMPPLILGKDQVEHIDGDPTNNEISNLRVVRRP